MKRGGAERKEFSIPPINAPINFDFRPIKEAKRLAVEQVALARKVEADKKAEEQQLAEERRMADEAREAKRVAAEQAVEERKKKEEAARVSRIQQSTQNEFTSDSRLSLDSARKKCVDLGFKSGRESFGKCLLQLSK